ncbi:ligand-binding sensor domain-containing protein [Mucilaginibacter limnophilus]|uniref:ligand-binding sensor domain-containing protein n=1 Tax=Mucilaginibacter limnophilus TaxID=1932778 RepID=UPI0013E2D74A|nr:sensor histidine kinase [Mucilaginibacter limnophilus]
MSTHLKAQPYYFTHYQVESGLSNNAVICSIIDKKGFMWFGTKDGLNRFDGYTFKVFRNDLDDKSSLGNNFIFSLYDDPDGILWVGTERGLYKYNYDTEKFSFLKNSSTNSIRAIVKDGQKNLWFIAGLTLFKCLPDGSIKSYAGRFEATTLCLSDGNLWTGTPQGFLNRYNPGSDSFTPYNVFNPKIPATSNWIEKVHSDRAGRILVGTSNQGVKIFNTNKNTYIDLITHKEDGTDIFARDFIRRSADELWIATESGIYIYNEKTRQFTNLQKQYNNPYSISDNAIYTLCKDREGGIWAGTYFGGVNYYPTQYTFFEKFYPKVGENSISGNAVREICRDGRGNLWIGTEDAGLNKLDLRSGQFTNYLPCEGRGSITNTNIHGLLVSGNYLWIGTFEHGLDVMDLRTEKVVRHYNAGPAPNQFKSNFIYCTLKTSKGKILLGTAVGLYMYNEKSDDFTLMEQTPGYAFHTMLIEDSNGTIWAGTFRDGVYYFNLQTGVKGYINHDPSVKTDLSMNRVTGILEGSDHYIWITSESGLFKYDPVNKKLKQFTVKEGLPGDLLYSVLEDDNKQLWISSSKGLICFNMTTEKVVTYTKSNGLLNDQFNYNSAYKDTNGNMYFGSVKGLVNFNPSKFVRNTFIPPVYITGFQVHNNELRVDKNNSPLKESIISTKHITLDYRSSSFSIDFSALSYTSPNTIEYAYKMEGLDEQWTYIKANRKAYFTELPPGKYTFKVKAANSSGVWNTGVTTLTIQIRPPFWKSEIAYLLYTLAAAGCIFYIIRRYKQKLQAEHDHQREIFENEKEKEIYQAKIEFFTNVAHEIRTPLTLIKAPMEKVVKRAAEVPDIEKNLRIMEKNTDRLLTLTNQLLDFRRTESKGFSLNFVKADITELLREIWINFQPAAERRSINYKLLMPERPFFAYIDPEALTKVVSNLLDNAIKYGRSEVSIELMPVKRHDKSFKIEVRNNGKPLPSELHELIFEPFFRVKDHEKKTGTGIGLSISRALTELHNGRLEICEPRNGFNIFVITLPIHQLFEFNLNGKWKKL